jgi:hypothetical protein
MSNESHGKIPIRAWSELAFVISLNRRSPSGAEAAAVQTLRNEPASANGAKRLDCARLQRRSRGARTCASRRSRWCWAAVLVLAAWIQSVPATITIPPPWRWSNPAPHGANVVDLAANSDLTVQVGERGQIYLSDDWQTWIPRDTYTTAALRGATFFNGRLVISGEAGTIMFADDPWNFHGLTLGTTDWLESVAASTNLVVAVGDNAAIYTSADAVNWQRITPSFNNWLRSVACSGTNFVAVGEGGMIASSVSGNAWQVRASGTTTNLNRVAWLGDHYLAVGDGGKAFTSANGSQWSAVNLGATNYLFAAAGVTNSHLAAGNLEARLTENGGTWSNQLSAALTAPAPLWTYYTALWNDGYYLLSGRSGMVVIGAKTNPAESVKWEPLVESVRSWLWAVTRTPTHYLAVGDYGTILSSPNGVDWDYELVPLTVTNSVLLGVGGNSNLLLAAGSQGTILWATNIYLWKTNSTKPTTNDLQGVCFDGANFILTGGNGTVLTSVTGTNWTRRTAPTTAFLMSVASFPGGLVTVGSGGAILTSTDRGTNWTTRAAGTTNWLSQVRWLNDRLMAVGQNGSLLSSTDGVQWRTNASGTTAWLNAADFVEGTWFVVGNLGTVLASPDATNWFSLGTLTKKSLYGVTIHNGQLITVGTEGAILRSQLVPDPTPIQVAKFSRASGINVFLFTGATDQQFRLQSSADLTTWTDGALLEFLDGSGTLIYAEDTSSIPREKQYYRALRTR